MRLTASKITLAFTIALEVSVATSETCACLSEVGRSLGGLTPLFSRDVHRRTLGHRLGKDAAVRLLGLVDAVDRRPARCHGQGHARAHVLVLRLRPAVDDLGRSLTSLETGLRDVLAV